MNGASEVSIHNIRIADGDGNPGFESELKSALRASLEGELPQSDNLTIAVSARTESGRLVAGLYAGTSYDWLHIALLWVDDAFRRRGLGRTMLERAFGRAKATGCSACWLETSNPSAREFYQAEGFTEFACLSNEGRRKPDTHRRWFLQRTL